MALEGNFRDFGLADIFQLVGLQKKTGVLTLRGSAGQLVTVSFEQGAVVFADEFQRSESERLGMVLQRTRRVSPEQLARAMEVQKSTAKRLGYVLVEQQLISRQELAQALQLQVKETVYRLFRWQEGSYHFSAEPVTYDREIYLPLSAELLLMEGVRMIDEWPILEKKIPSFQMVFERIPGAVPGRPPAAAPAKADIEDLLAIVEEGAGAVSREDGGALSARESGILALVDGVRTVQELVDLGQLGEFETCKVLYGLLSLNLIRSRREGASAPVNLPEPGRRRAVDARGYGVVAAAALVAVTAFLFNPWGIVAQGFRARASRRAAVALTDAVRLRRVRLALEAYYLEKQSYPPSLDKLAESRLLGRRELRSADGASFPYRGGARDYRLGLEGGR